MASRYYAQYEPGSRSGSPVSWHYICDFHNKVLAELFKILDFLRIQNNGKRTSHGNETFHAEQSRNRYS
jgi:hypothetical protein